MKTMAWGIVAPTSFSTVGPPTGSNTTRAPLPPVRPRISLTRSCSSVATTWVAPASIRACLFELLRVRAMGVAPTRLAIWMAARPDAARGRGDHERIARLQASDVNQGSGAGQVLHPDRGRLLPRERGGVVGHGMDRGAHQVAVDPVVVHGEGRDGADRIADLDPLAARADGGDRPGRLIPDAGREIGLFDVLG